MPFVPSNNLRGKKMGLCLILLFCSGTRKGTSRLRMGSCVTLLWTTVPSVSATVLTTEARRTTTASKMAAIRYFKSRTMVYL